MKYIIYWSWMIYTPKINKKSRIPWQPGRYQGYKSVQNGIFLWNGHTYILELAQNVIHPLFDYLFPNLGQLTSPEIDLLFSSYSFGVKKWDTKLVLQSRIPVPPPNQGYRVNFHVLMFSKRWQTDNTIPYNMFFSILKWCPHLKLRRNQTFHDILGYIRDVKVSGMVYFNDSARRNGCGSGIVRMHTRQVQNHNAIDHRAIFQFGHFSILNFAKSIIFWNT